MRDIKKIVDDEWEDVNESINGDAQEDVSEFDGIPDGAEDADSNADDFSDSIADIDFSELRGDFKKSFHKVNKTIAHNRFIKKKKPLTKEFKVNKKATIFGQKKKLAKVIVPTDRKVIIEGVSRFILSDSATDNAVKNIGYYKGKKLKRLVLTIDNSNSAVDLNLELFNPSMPLDFIYNTSQNLNDMIQVGGPNSDVAYSDILYNLLANPALMVNCKFVFNGADVASQMNQTMTIKNKSITGEEKLEPLTIPLNVDIMQYQSNMVMFDLYKKLNRPYIPDGMDVIQYKVLAGNTANLAFYYKQISLKRFFFSEARKDRKTLR